MSATLQDTPRTSTGDGTSTPAFGYARALVCRACGAEQELGPFYACLECFGPLEVGYDFPDVTRAQIEAGPKNIWRYRSLLPVRDDIATIPNTEPGFTRLIKADNLARELGLKTLWVKDDSGNPTHSFKDRVVAVALAAARELGLRVLACPSTGNLANAVAAAAARAGIKSVVFIPDNLERPKILTTAVYGGTLVAVKGTYDDCNKLASEIAGEEEGWAFVNVNVRPYYAEGSKTLGFEVAEQLGWRLPGQVVIPVASGQPADQGRQGLHRARPPRAGRRDAYRSSAPRPTGARRWPRRSATATTWYAGQAGHHRQVARDRQPRRRAVRARRRTPYRWCGRGGQRRRGARRHPAAGPHRGHLRRDRGRRDGRDAEEAVETGQLDPEAETVVFNTGDGLKTLDAMADRVGPAATIDPSYAAFTATGL